mmetsp:Transcript_10081/g.17387  ORF Transcript_10081/g.17387 Transcript_10081/m.17387 type:complete len:282 (-) Transcript_10081:173-1018(-)
MGSRTESAIVAYSRSRSRSRSRDRDRGRGYRGRDRSRSSPSYGRSRSKRSKSEDGDAPVKSEATRMASEKIQQKKFAEEQAIALAKAAAERVESAEQSMKFAQQALESAIQESAKRQAAVAEASREVQDAIQEASKVKEQDSIQRIVDERQDARHARDYKKSDRLLEELRELGVQVNDGNFTWSGPGGTSGKVKGATLRRPGAWDCPECGSMCFAGKTRCFKCGASKDGKSSGGGGGGGRRDKGRRSPSYDRDDRRGRDRRGRSVDSDDSSPSRSPPRRRR